MSACGCGCCEGIAVSTPSDVANPPGLAAIAHRVGTHGEFFASMLARLSSPAYPALHDLTVRTPDDPAIALMDGAAMLGDLLTFYTERIANEGYLRTATEETSLRLLGRLVGYLPRPGVSAGTFLAYTLDADPVPGRDLAVTIPRGSRAQSVPQPGQETQSFETAEELAARWSWNDLTVRRTRPFQLTLSTVDNRLSLPVAGVATNLKPGDRILFVFGAEPGRQKLVVVPGVEIDRERDVTFVGLPRPLLKRLDDLAEGLADLLRPLAEGTSDEPIVGRSAIIRRFVAQVVVPLWEALSTLSTPTLFSDALADALERVAETKEIAKQYHSIVDWLTTFGGKLSALYDQARQLEPPQPEEEPEPSLFTALGFDRLAANGTDPSVPSTPDSPATRGLGALLGALRTAPAQPPASSLRLARNPGAIYAPGSDLGAQLLARLDPRLAEGLYTAWRQLDLTAPLALQDLQAMRIVATPFGATAPLRAVPDGAGGVTQVEWSLEATLQLIVRVDYDEDGAPSRAEFDFLVNAEQWHLERTVLTDDETVDFGPGQVAFNHDDDHIEFSLEEHLPVHSLTFGHATQAQPLTFTIDEFGEQTVSINGSFFRFYDDGSTVFLTRLADAGEQPRVEVRFSSTSLIPASILTLDAVYEGIGQGSWVVIERPRKGSTLPSENGDELALVSARVTQSRVIAKQAFGISGKVTELTLDRAWTDKRDTLLSQIRDATVYARGESLALAREPVTEDVGDARIELDRLYDGLTPGRWVIVTGERSDLPGRPVGVPGTEVTMIASVIQDVAPELPGDVVRTTIVLAAPLRFRYRRETVHIYANVAPATHGATRNEPIGSGDASKANQTFALRQGPLTWLAADNPLGATSTLEVRVDGVAWHEVDTLAGRGPTDRVYVTAPNEAGTLSVTFGDGLHGSRLPTGVENVRAGYRVGVGRAGNVNASQITQLTTRPLGVSGVTNPVAATGGAEPDGPGQLRRNIPVRATALDRLVSVPDFEDFARARAGIGRASARKLFDGRRDVVHVTVAGADDIALRADSPIVTALRAAYAVNGDIRLPVRVAVREAVLLVVVAGVRVAPDYSWDLVEPVLRAALVDRLGFDRRELGQPAYLSEVVATAQSVPGVDFIDVDSFAGVPGSLTPDGLLRLADLLAVPNPVVPAGLARYDVAEYEVRAEQGETLTEVAAHNGITVAELLELNPGIKGVERLPQGHKVIVFRGVRPAQLVMLAGDLPDTLILREVR